MATRTFKGNAPQTRLAGGITGVPANFAVVLDTGYPATGPFVVVIDKGLASEEKILCSGTSGNTITITTRGFDDTTSVNHADQAVVEHVLDAVIMTTLVGHLDNGVANPHPEYFLDADHTAASHATLTDIEHPHTWAVAADVRVPSVDVDYIPGFFVSVPAGQAVTLTRARHRINVGTSATVKLQKNGVDITGWTAISVTTANTTLNAADSVLADGDYIQLIVTAVVGSPKNLSFSAYLKYEVA